MHLDIYSDTICPWCYIGKRRLERAIAERPQPELSIRWRTFQLNPDMPPEGMDRQRYLELKFGGRAGAARIYDPIRAVGLEEGIEFNFDAMTRTPNTLNSHRLIRFAASSGLQTEVVQALFDRYFIEAQDIGELDLLVDCAQSIGLGEEETRRYLESGQDLEHVRAEDSHARAIGIQGVPSYILNSRFVLSGAHEPEVLFRMFELGQQDDVEAPTTESERLVD